MDDAGLVNNSATKSFGAVKRGVANWIRHLMSIVCVLFGHKLRTQDPENFEEEVKSLLTA